MGEKPQISTLTTLAGLVLAVSANYLVFQLFDRNFFLWFASNGTFIALITSLLAISFEQFEKDIKLVSSDPRVYFAAWETTLGLTFEVLGSQLQRVRFSQKPQKGKTAEQFAIVADGILALLLILSFCAIVFLWFFVVVPVQYFVFLVSGALSRALHRSDCRIIARREDFTFEVKAIDRMDAIEPKWWDAGFDRKPVAVTGILSALSLLGLELVLGMWFKR